MILRRIVLTILSFSLAFSAQAEGVEVHAVGIYEGFSRMASRKTDENVDVVVERADVPIVLALSSYDPIHWHVVTRPGVQIETIILHGYQSDESQVFLDGVRVEPHVLEYLGVAYRNKGTSFRALVRALADTVGVTALSSFHGAYRAPGEPFRISEASKDPQLRVYHLSHAVRTEMVPNSLVRFLNWEYARNRDTVVFSEEGFTLTLGADTRQFPTPLEFYDEISWPVAGVYDDARKRLYGVSLGGAGHIYQFDIATRAWSVLTDMNNVDAGGMLYDPEANRLIIGYGLQGVGITIYDLDSGEFTDIPLVEDGLLGLTDLYDPGNGPPPSLIPEALFGNELLVRAAPRHALRFRPGETPPTRTYLVNLGSGEAILVAYDDGARSDP